MGVGALARAVLLAAALGSAAALPDSSSIDIITRKEDRDIFLLTGDKCQSTRCAEFGALNSSECACACPVTQPLYREDRELCVSDIAECSLASFGSGPSAQRIPFVYLPLKGQIIHPSKEITFPGVITPICAVSGAQFLTRKGFLDLRNTIDADVPFSLFRDEGRTFLQWGGESELRTRMSGRVMLVRLLCRDVAAAPPAPAPLDLRGVFTPCVAFRVQGSPAQHITNVSEVQFALNANTSAATNSRLTVSEYIAIGITSVILGMIYVASVFLYLHIKKRRKRAHDEELSRQKALKGLKNKDGTPITENDIVRINNEREQVLNSDLNQCEDGVIKSNPLLGLCRQFHDMKGSFTSDSGSNLSDSEEPHDHSFRDDCNRNKNQLILSAQVHPSRNDIKLRSDIYSDNISHRDESGIERLPDEHVSIIETTDPREDRTDIVRPVGNTRRKLYFNPAYFEPHLMAEPPAAALEFLVKIREVITIAKHKMASKRFQPILNEIPEEETYQSVAPSLDFYQGLGSQRSGSVVSLKRENSRKRSIACVGCPGCKNNGNEFANNIIAYDVPACANCLIKTRGDKQNSIRKWLEDIPMLKQQTFQNELPNQDGIVNSLLSLPLTANRNKVKKQNSFHITNYGINEDENFTYRKKTSSVKSAPPIRNYNFPLPDFEEIECLHNNRRFGYGSTIGRAEDIRPIGLSNLRTGSLRGQPLANQRKNKFITQKSTLPDMINEAIAIDSSKNYNHSSSDDEKIYKKLEKISGPIGNDLQCVDYETDSLERSSNKKGFSTPTEYADVPSSQASPSLSAALPLDEELTMRNAVYKNNFSSNSNTPSPNINTNNLPANHYETIGKKASQRLSNSKVEPKTNGTNDYSLVSEVYVNNSYNFGSAPTSPSGSECSMGSRKLVNTTFNDQDDEKPGCLTIEVKDPPENYIKIHESDSFEPDTLDRKHPKHKEILDSIQFSRKDLLNHIKKDDDNPPNQTIQLKSSGTFKKSDLKTDVSESEFNSLRHIYEHRNNTFTRPKLPPSVVSGSSSLDDNLNENSDGSADWKSEEGRILTLELRHSKRQRQCTPPSIKQLKNLARPDVLPPLPPTDDIPIYEQPIHPPRKVEMDVINGSLPKNVNGRSFSPRTSMNTMTINAVKPAELICGPTCSPIGASVQSQYSDYENVGPTFVCEGPTCRTQRNIQNATLIKSHIVNGVRINTNTYVKSPNSENRFPKSVKRRKGHYVEDSGYLSSDSTSSKQTKRQIVVPKGFSGSESDDTENEARSESGAESIETHSVFFGSFRKLPVPANSINSVDSRNIFRRALDGRKSKR